MSITDEPPGQPGGGNRDGRCGALSFVEKSLGCPGGGILESPAATENSELNGAEEELRELQRDFLKVIHSGPRSG